MARHNTKKLRRYHAGCRAQGRAGVSLKAIEAALDNGSYEVVEHQSNTRALCKTNIEGSDVWFISSKRKGRGKEVITVLTADMVRERSRVM